MALTRSRWLWLTLAGAVVVAAALLQSPEPQQRFVQDAGDRLRVRAERASIRSIHAAERLHVLQVRDSAQRAVPGSRAGVHVGNGFDSAHALAAQQVAASLGALTTGVIPMKVFIVHDTGTHIRGAPRRRFRGNVTVDHFLPRTQSEACVVVVRVNTRSGEEHARFAAVGEMASQMTLRRILGPCSFFRSFGLPGAPMRAWLADRGWHLAELGGWQYPRLPWVAPPWHDPLVEFPYYDLVGRQGSSCLAGDRAECADAFITGPSTRRFATSPDVFASTYNAYLDFDSPWWSGSLAFGTLERTVLADMVRDLGEERFRAFWTATSPPGESFTAATGSDLGEWVYGWATSGYYKRSRGPAMASMAPAYSALLVILAAALAIGAARRRQVG